MVEVTRDCVNQGGGYGLQVPCIYRLHGPKFYVEKAPKILCLYVYTSLCKCSHVQACTRLF